MLIVCAGTGTSVGKTWVGAAVLGQLRSAGLTVAARKPAQSFAAGDAEPTDAAVLADASGLNSHHVCPAHRWYPLAMAPPMAAAALGHPSFTLDELIDELAWPPETHIRWVESAGGVRSPLSSDGDTVDLCDRVRPDLVVLVADAGLGTINAVRLSADALAAHPVLVCLNRYDARSDLHRRNGAWLTDRCRLDVVTTPEAVVDRLVSPPPARARAGTDSEADR